MMKYLFTAAAAVLLIWGCAPRPVPQGGAFDSSIDTPAAFPAHDTQSPFPPARRSLGPHGIPGKAPEELSPKDNDSDDDGPEFLVPAKNRVLHI